MSGPAPAPATLRVSVVGATTSDADADDPDHPKKALRTVTPPFRGHRDTEMDVIGRTYFPGLLILLVPLLPFIVIIWVLTKVLDRTVDRE